MGTEIPPSCTSNFECRPADQSPLKDLSVSCTTRMASFWIGDGLKDFLFKGFNVNAHEGLAFVCIGLASSAILFEGLRTLRDSFLHKFIDKQKANRAFENRKRLSQRLKIGARQGGSPAPGTSHDYGGGGDIGDASISLMRTPLEEEDDYELSPKNGSSFAARFSDESEGRRKFKIFLNLILSTFLHMIYILLGYILMLSVMTFNVWLLVAIAIGIGIGQFIFGVYRRTDIVLSHHPETVITSRKSSSNFGEEEFSSPSTATLDMETHAGQGSTTDNNIPASQSTLDNQGVSGNQTHCLYSVSSGSDNNSHSSEHQTAEIIVHSNLESTVSPNASNVSSL